MVTPGVCQILTSGHYHEPQSGLVPWLLKNNGNVIPIWIFVGLFFHDLGFLWSLWFRTQFLSSLCHLSLWCLCFQIIYWPRSRDQPHWCYSWPWGLLFCLAGHLFLSCGLLFWSTCLAAFFHLFVSCLAAPFHLVVDFVHRSRMAITSESSAHWEWTVQSDFISGKDQPIRDNMK